MTRRDIYLLAIGFHLCAAFIGALLHSYQVTGWALFVIGYGIYFI